MATTHSFNLRNFRTRKLRNYAWLGLIWLFALSAILPLLFIFYHVIREGLPAINWSFFTNLPSPVGMGGGGMANALLGSLKMLFVASLIGVSLGVLCGIYLSEYGVGKMAAMLKLTTDIMASIPSIIIGLFVYQLLVVPMGGFSGWAGSVALGLIMLPIVTKTTEEILKLMPAHIREAGLALGIPRWKVILYIVLKGSLAAITTGVMLAMARVAGETAPLLFTALNNQFWGSMAQPTASLPVQIYNYAISPFDEWHRQAWAGAALLVSSIFLINLTTRWVLRNYAKRAAN